MRNRPLYCQHCPVKQLAVKHCNEECLRWNEEKKRNESACCSTRFFQVCVMDFQTHKLLLVDINFWKKQWEVKRYKHLIMEIETMLTYLQGYFALYTIQMWLLYSANKTIMVSLQCFTKKNKSKKTKWHFWLIVCDLKQVSFKFAFKLIDWFGTLNIFYKNIPCV